MKKNKKSVYKKWWFWVILSVLIIVVLFVISAPTIISKKEVNTKDGMIKLVISKCGTLCSWMEPIKQTVYFSTTESHSTLVNKVFHVGDAITFNSEVSCDYYGTPSQPKLDAIVTITVMPPSGTSLTMSSGRLSNITNHGIIKVAKTYPSTTIGSYSVSDKIDCYLPGTNTNVYSVDNTNTKRYFSIQASGSTTCPSDSIASPSTFHPGYSGYAHVSDIICENWFHYSGTDCTGSIIPKNCKTTCSSDSYCDTSFTQQVCDGKTSCVLQTQDTPTPSDACSDGVMNGAETGIDCGGSCAACSTNPSGCSQDTTILCNDKSIVTTEQCVNNVLFPTNDICTDGNPGDTNGTVPGSNGCLKDVQKICPDKTVVTTKTCSAGVLTSTNNLCPDGSNPDVNPPLTIDWGFWSIIIIVGIVFIIFIIVLNKRYKWF